MNRQIINVFYPADGGKILLRTEKDWNRNVGLGLMQSKGATPLKL
jgi:hypothetical protein